MLAADSILLVRKGERCVRDAGNDPFIIQRCCRGVKDFAVDRKVDVTESKGLRAGFRSGSLKVFCWSEEPVESDNDEVDSVGVEAPVFRMLGVESIGEAAEDSDVGWVGTRGRVVFVAQPLEGSHQ